MSTNHTTFSGPRDWKDWSKAFRTQAWAFGVWMYVDPAVAEPPAAPTAVTLPDVTTYPREGGTGRQLARNLRGLSAEHYARYTTELTVYREGVKAYEQYDQGIGKLEVWVREHASCEPYLGLFSREAQIDLRKHYERVKEYTRKMGTWAQEWGILMTRATEAKVPEAVTMTTWFEDFIAALSRVATTEVWATNTHMNRRADVVGGKITYGTLTTELRKHIAMQAQAGERRRGSPGKKARQLRSTSRDSKRARSNTDTSKRPRCEAGTISHELAPCFYVFPEEAPEGFYENSGIYASGTLAREHRSNCLTALRG
ncbi:hypothetical protein B0T26DRAFT_755782 [Lasiosphaeria miniovina]|uniref:Uncharacterized protein n=1 Tax=Lasiosphaeria miniovina TaxID=1954250 RepID=A0AA39ZZ32_9PEZI|nr:uncharacterized protein B0T26DRAFT_755782 [Lasiosphaeria miniovina]KAK0706259.1 hypothetical protein B0T26DRAFT_755782 [Lasiosphaeria miniovina]